MNSRYCEFLTFNQSNTLNIKINGTLICGCYVICSCDELIAISGIGATQIYLPPSPVLCNNRGQRISVVDICGNALNSPITINGNGKNINNYSCSMINTDYGSTTFVYNGIFWSAIAFVN